VSGYELRGAGGQAYLLPMEEPTKPDPVDDAMQYFAYDHLPADRQAASKPFGELAAHIVATLPRCPQRTIALNKLLEAKDAAVRAAVVKR
jgi:hypothetical protein